MQLCQCGFGGWRCARLTLYGVDVSREENEILDFTLILTAHSLSKTQDLESKVKLVQESATQDLNQ
jgi:hypothetical protein